MTFVIPGKPFAWKRAGRAGKFSFEPADQKHYKQTLQAIALPHFPQPIDGPVKLTVRATFGTAKSWSKKKTASLLHCFHTQKPDTDNLAKAIMDGLNRIAWADDSQVVWIDASKVWGTDPKTVVTVEAL